MIQTAEEFIKLRSSRIKSEYDRSALEEAPIEIWYQVIDEHPDYREWVIHNKTVPLEILEYLYEIDPSVKRDIARKRKLSVELFKRLAADADEDVRFQIAINRKTPLFILEVLMRDREKDVARAAEKNHADRTRPVASVNKSPCEKHFMKVGTCHICNGDIIRGFEAPVSEPFKP